MGLLGRYTTYVGGVATDARKLLSKLFPAGPFAKEVTAGDEKAAQKVIAATATAVVVNGVGGLRPSNGIQSGDMGMFPNGVDLSYSAKTLPADQFPDVSKVKWKSPGDPGDAYIPDITSPGPGKTDGRDKAVDPGVGSKDVPRTSSDPAGQNLRNPVVDGPAIYNNNTIGSQQKPGESGGNV